MDKLKRADQSQVGGMMVRLRKGEERPAGARRMTDDEVMDMQHSIISSWKPPMEMWPFKFSMGIVGISTTLSGLAVNALCRKQLKLGHISRLTTVAPTVGLPVLLSSAFHHFLVTKPVLLGDFPCTVCASLRSGSLQALIGGAYPAILAPLLCVAVARKHHAYPVPGLKETSRIVPFLRAVLPSASVVMSLVAVNFLIGVALSERQTFLFAKYLSPTSSQLREREEEIFDERV